MMYALPTSTFWSHQLVPWFCWCWARGYGCITHCSYCKCSIVCWRKIWPTVLYGYLKWSPHLLCSPNDQFLNQVNIHLCFTYSIEGPCLSGLDTCSYLPKFQYISLTRVMVLFCTEISSCLSDKSWPDDEPWFIQQEQWHAGIGEIGRAANVGGTGDGGWSMGGSACRCHLHSTTGCKPVWVSFVALMLRGLCLIKLHRKLCSMVYPFPDCIRHTNKVLKTSTIAQRYIEANLFQILLLTHLLYILANRKYTLSA